MSNQTTSGGIGISGALGVLFIGLKLSGYIEWSWILVLGPFWMLPALLLCVAAVAFVFHVAIEITGGR